MRQRGFVVAHSHWDRAWYLPFQACRLRLVRMVDGLLDLLERDAAFTSFTLDGQTVLLEDYLDVRPDQRARLAALVRAGRLSIGPWYTLPDLFLPCGEAAVRNLQLGRRTSAEFGEPMDVGYLPDPFGHFAQLPQVLRGFGISSFMFMRGAGDGIDRTGSLFDWRAPDGSTVLAVYLRDGYLAAGALGHPAAFGRFDGRRPSVEEARLRLEGALALLAPLQRERSVVLPCGGDHMPPQPELPGLLRELNRQDLAVELTQSTLPEFVAAVRSEGLPHQVFEGDLIGNVHHPILLGVYSTRIYLKQQNREAEHALLRLAEPLLACLPPGAPGSHGFLDTAWRLLLRNHAHDDLCGCSVDEVHAEDETRFTEVTTLARALVTEGLERLVAAGLAGPTAPAGEPGALSSDVFLFNPHPFPLKARIRTSILVANPGGEFAPPTRERALRALSSRGAELPLSVERSEPRVARSAFLETTWGRRYHLSFEVDLPPLGYEIVHVFETSGRPAPRRLRRPALLASLLRRVEVADGRLALTELDSGRLLPSLLRFEYESDAGDTYSFGPVKGQEPLSAVLTGAAWKPAGGGLLSLRFRLRVPAGLSNGRCSRRRLPLHLDVDVALGPEDDVQFTVRYENRAEDGRLRALLPLGFPADTLLVDGHFRLAPRSVPEPREPRQRPYPGELPYDTFHQGEFAFAERGGRRTWLANRGHPELSLVTRDGEPWMALTLHRAVGMLSVTGGALRQCGAGPAVPVPGAQCQRPLEHRFAWGTGELSQPEVVRRALAFAGPVHAQEVPCLPHAARGGLHPRAASFLELDNPWVRLSACRPWGEACVAMRLFNWSGVEQAACLTLGFPARAWCLATLDEAWDHATEQPLDGDRLRVVLGPYQIRTVIVR